MATKKFSELTTLDPSADLTKTYIPVYDEVSSTTRKISLQQVNDAVELTIPFAQAAFNVANTATTNASTADQKAIAAGLYANSAFLRANNSLNVQSGGTVTGDLTLTGNLSITGCTASLVVSTFRTSDPVIDLSYGVSGSPTQNAGVRVLRGDEPSAQLRWNETSNLWDFTNDGTTYNGIAAAWVESFSANSYIHANAAFAAANAASADQTARNQANSSYIHANAAYTASNTANAYTITVNNLLNNTITNVSGYSIKTNSAYDYANATTINVSIVANYTNSAYALANIANNRAYSAQDNSGVASSYANSGFGVANSASSYANGAFTTANIAIPAASYANGAFGIANSASSYANGAFTTANIAIPAASYANGAFARANTGVTNAATADQKAVSAGSYGNSAFQSANTAETALLLYDTRITIAADYANSAFIQANVADQRAVTSGSYANAAFVRANTSLNVASGGTVTGDIITQGNMYVQKLIYTGNTTVEQTTSRGTGVTLNSSFGDVILYNGSMTAGQIDAIAVTNNKAKAGDLIVCSVLGSPGTYIAGGYCTTDSIIVLWIKNITDSSTSTMQPIIKFALIQPVTSV